MCINQDTSASNRGDRPVVLASKPSAFHKQFKVSREFSARVIITIKTNCTGDVDGYNSSNSRMAGVDFGAN